MPKRLRRLLPPTGAPYELFDCSVFLLILAWYGYVHTPVPAINERALQAPFALASASAWGYTLAACAVVGIVTAYLPRVVHLGYAVVITASSFWSICFAIGLAFYDASARSLLSVIVYAWIASRLYRESGTPRSLR